MQLILGSINGNYLRNITERAAKDTDEVLAAVAYATDSDLLFDWCWDHKIPLKFYGRLDENIAVSVPILEKFLSRRSANFECWLVQHHHAKVIWFRGVGVYIGSANLTSKGWYNNIEAGCFFSDQEIDDVMANELIYMFDIIRSKSTPLTEEVVVEMESRSRDLNFGRVDSGAFLKSPSFVTWSGLVYTGQKSATSRQRDNFLKEWHATLQYIRDIGIRVSAPENRPFWIGESVPTGAQADQFLHAYYYHKTFDGRKAMYQKFFDENKNRKDEALEEALDWWRQSPELSAEQEQLNTTAPFLCSALEEKKIIEMTYEQFREICMNVHAIKDYARRVPNRLVNLPDNGTQYAISQKVEALSRRIWNDTTDSGTKVTGVFRHILYGGEDRHLPERLWEAVMDRKWKIDGLGVSALGEIVGWGLPDRFPPRNGRTSKALRSLGYDVTVHV